MRSIMTFTPYQISLGPPRELQVGVACDIMRRETNVHGSLWQNLKEKCPFEKLDLTRKIILILVLNMKGCGRY